MAQEAEAAAAAGGDAHARNALRKRGAIGENGEVALAANALADSRFKCAVLVLLYKLLADTSPCNHVCAQWCPL